MENAYSPVILGQIGGLPRTNSLLQGPNNFRKKIHPNPPWGTSYPRKWVDFLLEVGGT